MVYGVWCRTRGRQLRRGHSTLGGDLRDGVMPRQEIPAFQFLPLGMLHEQHARHLCAGQQKKFAQVGQTALHGGDGVRFVGRGRGRLPSGQVTGQVACDALDERKQRLLLRVGRSDYNRI